MITKDDVENWMVELKGEKPTKYLCVRDKEFTWTTDIYKALRFGDKGSAAQCMDGWDCEYTIESHIWGTSCLQEAW